MTTGNADTLCSLASTPACPPQPQASVKRLEKERDQLLKLERENHKKLVEHLTQEFQTKTANIKQKAKTDVAKAMHDKLATIEKLKGKQRAELARQQMKHDMLLSQTADANNARVAKMKAAHDKQVTNKQHQSTSSHKAHQPRIVTR